LTQSELGDKIKVLDKNPSVSNDGLVLFSNQLLNRRNAPRHREFSKRATESLLGEVMHPTSPQLNLWMHLARMQWQVEFYMTAFGGMPGFRTYHQSAS
jgi:hypothetical protein